MSLSIKNILAALCLGIAFVPANAVVKTVASADSLAFPLTDVIYTSVDSAEVVKLLREECGNDDVIYYARRLRGRPYAMHTLEIADPEKLVVNLSALDCTTLVETVCALALTKRQKADNFAAYCRNLESLRYWNGRRDGYCSRLHYFTWWIFDNKERGKIEEVNDSNCFVMPVQVNNYYMSRYPQRYKFLKGNSVRVQEIRQLEKKFNGADGFYLPKSKTGLSRKHLSFIKDGDVIAIVTSKSGLDYSHLGFAVWGKDDRLHLLNASMVKGRVVEDTQTLKSYLYRYGHTKGIKVLRLK